MLRAWALLRPAFFGFIALAALLLEVAPARGEALALVLAIDVSASVIKSVLHILASLFDRVTQLFVDGSITSKGLA